MTKTSIAKNASYMTLASIGQKFVAFVYFTMIARSIGAEGTGKYFFALSFTTVFVVFVDLGLTNVLIREAAKLKSKMQDYFSTVLSAKIVLGVLAYIAAIITINLLGYPVETRHLVYLSGVTMLLDSLHLSIYGVLRSIGDLRFESAGIVGSQLLTLIMGSIFLWMGLPLIFLILAFTVPSALNAIYASEALRRKYNIVLRPKYDKAIFKHIAYIAIPFALAAVFARVYSYADSLILSKLAGDAAVGWYAIAYKITFAFQFIPLALVAVLYPRFSEYCETSKRKLALLFERGVKYLLIIAFPIAVGIALLAKDIILLLYTAEYLPSVLPLQILILSLVFSFLSFPIGALLNACHKQVAQTTIVGAVMVVNIIMNLILIPRLGVVGAASAAFIGNMLLTLFGYLVIPSITKISHTAITKTAFQVSISVLVMGLAVWYSNIGLHFGISIVIGALVYPMMLFITRTVTKNDIEELVGLIRK